MTIAQQMHHTAPPYLAALRCRGGLRRGRFPALRSGAICCIALCDVMPPPKRGAGRAPGRKTCRGAGGVFDRPRPCIVAKRHHARHPKQVPHRESETSDATRVPRSPSPPVSLSPCGYGFRCRSGTNAPAGAFARKPSGGESPGGHEPRQSLRACHASSSPPTKAKKCSAAVKARRNEESLARRRMQCLRASGGPSLPGWLEIKRCFERKKRLEKKRIPQPPSREKSAV